MSIGDAHCRNGSNKLFWRQNLTPDFMPYHLVIPKPFFLFLLLLGGRLLAQDDLVIPDLHGDKESFAKLTDNTLRNELATFIITGTESMKPVSKLNKIPVKETGNSHMIFQKDSVKVIIRTGTFNQSKHKRISSTLP